ncbi:PREDICTED: uncharacterized protein LOC109479694 [Branchiostoma belcheri]|uniref:Uncharacterized protein LOC109479694 n=1 Tax=Branchiostoma belcheri TaxID=7741 RepID=A0A6P4ZKC1_BRABE|nr:PREDICTED: uncharacterized protein LOC109479694 [Branchiostoma belcheri]
MASSPEQDKVLNDYMLAWEEACSLGEIPRPSAASLALAGDLCALLLRGQRHTGLKDFLGLLGDQLHLYRSNPWVYRAQITENLRSGQFEKVFQLLQHFPFGPSADLVQLWDEAHYRQMERRTGKLLTPVGKFRLRKRFPPPLSIAPHGRKTLSLPREAKTKLQSWLLDHQDHPYPSRVEKYDLAELTGLTFKQVSTWFQNNRRRLHHHQDTSWARSPWSDVDIPSLKRSPRSPDGKQCSKGCGVSGRVQKANKKIVEKKKREKSTYHSSLGFGYGSICENVSPCNESVSSVKHSEGFPECSTLASHKKSTTQDRCHQGDGDTKLYCIMCAEDTITPVHKCSPHMEEQKHVEGTEKASCFKEQFLPCLDDNSNLQHCAQQCAVCSQTCLSANLRPASLHITGGEHFACPYTSFPTKGFYSVHCMDCVYNSAELVTPIDSYPLHLVIPGDSNPLHLIPTGDLDHVHLAEPWDTSPAHVTTAPGDCLMYTELQTVASPPTTFLTYNSFGAIPVAVHGATDTGIPIAVPGAAHGAVHGAEDIGIPTAVPDAVPGAVLSAIPGAVLGADPCATDTCISPAVDVDTVTANLPKLWQERDPCELISIACALLDLSINIESLED